MNCFWASLKSQIHCARHSVACLYSQHLVEGKKTVSSKPAWAT
jgi:hypothetical protein